MSWLDDWLDTLVPLDDEPRDDTWLVDNVVVKDSDFPSLVPDDEDDDA